MTTVLDYLAQILAIFYGTTNFIALVTKALVFSRCIIPEWMDLDMQDHF